MIHPEAFARAFKASGLIVYLEENVRAAIVAYLSDPEVLDEAREAVDPLSEDNRNMARDILQAIGAEVSK